MAALQFTYFLLCVSFCVDCVCKCNFVMFSRFGSAVFAQKAKMATKYRANSVFVEFFYVLIALCCNSLAYFASMFFKTRIHSKKIHLSLFLFLFCFLVGFPMFGTFFPFFLCWLLSFCCHANGAIFLQHLYQ